MERAKQLGASEVINFRSVQQWGRKVLEYTNGVGVDQVVEVGGAGTLAQSMEATRVGGFVGLIGILAGTEGEVNPIPVLMKSLRLQGVYVGSREMFEDMNTAMEVNEIKPVIDRVFPFEEAKEALQLMEGASHFGKIVVTG